MLQCNENEWVFSLCNMDETHRPNAKHQKADVKE